MSFKIHLIIVCVIIVLVYFIWQTILHTEPPQVVENTQEESPYMISVQHASWGLDCSYRSSSASDSKNNPFANNSRVEDDRLKEDNVLQAVSNLCNGRQTCNIPITPAALGDDPAPGCGGKKLVVEYRCFSYDRPWTIESKEKFLNIDCRPPEGTKP